MYNWGPLSSTHIQWAAFYSDEEHEISEVTKGERITLTFNLYWVSFAPTLTVNLSEGLDSLSWVSKLGELFKYKNYLKGRKSISAPLGSSRF